MNARDYEVALSAKFTGEELAQLVDSCDKWDYYKDLYIKNEKFRTYVDKINKSSGDPVAFILLKKTVQDVGDYYANYIPNDNPICSCEGLEEDKSC